MPKTMVKHLIIIAIALLFFNHPVYARWAADADAAVEVTFTNNDFTIRADGTVDQIIESQFKLLNEQGRESLSIMPLYYNHDSSRLEIIAAKTIVDGQQFPLDASLIEDKPLASASLQGFDQQNQIVLAFPNTKVGAEIYVKYKLTILKPNMNGLFESLLSYGHERMLNSSTKIKSEIPLYFNLNDPGKYLEVKQTKNGKQYLLDITLKRPVFLKIVDEPHGVVNPAKAEWIYVTTNNNWQDFGNKVAKPFNTVLKQPLPKLYQDIAAQAKTQTDPVQQINMVMSLLNDSIKYMGDWQTSKGKFEPKNLNNVTQTLLGDCKDFAAATAVILNNIGIKAYVAWVKRGEGMYDASILRLPGFNNFNHAMVKVVLADKTLWVDPTNYTLIADKILPDIADRQVLVLYPDGTKLEHIPAPQMTDNIASNHREIDLKDPNVATVHGKFVLNGLAATSFTGAELYKSKESIENAILSSQGSYEDMLDKKVTSPDLTSRIVQDLTFGYDFKEKNMTQRTNAGKAMHFSNALANRYLFNDDQVADFYIGAPGIVTREMVLKNITPVDTLPLNCAITSPWVDAKRTVSYQNNAVTITEEFKIKKSWLYNEEIKSAEFKILAADLALNFKEGVGIVFK